MNWRTKSALYRLLSFLPGGKALHEFAQRNLTRSLVPNPGRIGQKVGVALKYATWLKEHGYASVLESGTHLDFGAGWHPAIPLTFYSFGMQRQFLVDLRPVMRAVDVRGAIGIFREIGQDLAKADGLSFQRLPPEPNPTDSLADLFGQLGIRYDAPYGSLDESYANQVDLVTSTQVLLHIPDPPLRSLFSQIFKALRPGGVFLATIHLYPLYGGLSESQERLRHLEFSPQAWDKFGSDLTAYTRHKAPDYRRLLEKAGFSIDAWDVTAGSAADLAFLEGLAVDASFEDYSHEDLVARHLFFAVRKPQ